MDYVAARPAVGVLLRDWRQRRRMTQMDLALEAGVSARHLSFVETGRSAPSADMVKRLAEQLDVPLRERNELLLAAGYATATSCSPPRATRRLLDSVTSTSPRWAGFARLWPACGRGRSRFPRWS